MEKLKNKTNEYCIKAYNDLIDKTYLATLNKAKNTIKRLGEYSEETSIYSKIINSDFEPINDKILTYNVEFGYEVHRIELMFNSDNGVDIEFDKNIFTKKEIISLYEELYKIYSEVDDNIYDNILGLSHNETLLNLYRYISNNIENLPSNFKLKTYSDLETNINNFTFEINSLLYCIFKLNNLRKIELVKCKNKVTH